MFLRGLFTFWNTRTCPCST